MWANIYRSLLLYLVEYDSSDIRNLSQLSILQVQGYYLDMEVFANDTILALVGIQQVSPVVQTVDLTCAPVSGNLINC